MPKKLCCCAVSPRETDECCNPLFYTDFITLFGDTMAEHAEVSPKDWVALYVERPGFTSRKSMMIGEPGPECNCCCGSDESGGYSECPPVSDSGIGCNADPNNPTNSTCTCGCCSRYFESSRVEGASPIIFAYKHSGCKFIWYPREYAFNYNPYIAQCTGFLSSSTQLGQLQISCQPWAEQFDNRGAAGSYLGYCTDGNGLKGYDSPYLPCGCVPFPHIHGGVYDSLYNRVNVSLKDSQMGYVPHMLPFASPMMIQEKYCCWCANTSSQVGYEDYIKNRKDCYANTYPFLDQQGKKPAPEGASTCLPGAYCHNQGGPAKNPGYRRNCFARGISPYLLRTSAKNYKMAFEIWGHGDTPEKTYYFGPSYEATNVSINRLNKDIDISFRKVLNKRTKLKDQFIGTVHLEHHFECYAYRSDSGSSTIEMQAVQNHCDVLIAGFESYGGRITNSSSGSGWRWTPWKYDSIKWQIRRAIPRRAIYGGSGIPLFHFDLDRMETISKANNIPGRDGNGFDGKIFLSHYYRYFYSLMYFFEGSCDEPGDIPGPPEWDFSHLLNSYEYVTYWLEKMVEYKVIAIKDHSIDIAKEVNDLVRSSSYDSNNELVVSDEIANEVGGIAEYQKILDLFGVCGGNAIITPKKVKEVLLNTDGLSTSTGPDGNSRSMNIFLPRRAILPSFDGIPGITGWLESSSSYFSVPGFSQFGFTGAGYSTNSNNQISVPYFYNIEDENDIFNQVLSPQKVISGLGGSFIIDASGKITPFGVAVASEPPCNYNGEQYPPAIGCVPQYFRITELFEGQDFPFEEGDDRSNLVAKNANEIVDGRVVDLAFKGKDFAVALCDFNYGGMGPRCGQEEGANFDQNPAYEPQSESDLNPNLNSNNIRSSSLISCLDYEPFNLLTFRKNENKPGNSFRLKSWGSKALQYGTFAFSEKQQQYINNNFQSSDEYRFRTYEGQNRRYPGTNAWWIWTNVSSGMKHFAAIDDFGGVFIPPQADNTYGQSTKGLGAFDDDSVDGGFHVGFGTDFNYFPHIPRPGYVKDNEWSQAFYNNITLANTCYKKNICSCHYEQTGDCARGGAGFENCSDCIGPIKIGPDCTEPPTVVYDKTCLLLGKLVRYNSNSENIPIEAIDHPYRPAYTKVACGHYNTLLLTNENKLEIKGKFVKIDQNGEVIPDQPIIDAYVPGELLSKAGTWDVTYGCGITCSGPYGESRHSPILDATYSAPSENAIIKIIESSADYCVAVTNNNVIHVWGDSGMVPGKFDPNTYESEKTAYNTISFENVISIDSVSLGVHAFYISYKVRVGSAVASRVYSYTRFNLNIGTRYPDNLQNSNILDTSAGYIHGLVIYSRKSKAISWNPNAFAVSNSDSGLVNTLKYQFKNFSSLPLYFRRQAFFHALPGAWDYSKWMFGNVGCYALPPSTPFEQCDNCSALAYNIYKDPNDPMYFDDNVCKSGNPHYYWMRKDWRRATYQSLSQVIDSDSGVGGAPNRCKPDNAITIEGNGGSFANISGRFGTCLSNYGPVWGYGRPLANSQRFIIRTPFPTECLKIPCSIPPSYIYVRRSVCNNVPYTKEGIDLSPQNAYRSTKDVFQLLWTMFTDRRLGSCPGFSQNFHSYFKYSERHYYYGYDSEDGAWKIYDNPDFLGNVNPRVQTLNCTPTGISFDAFSIISDNSCTIECNPCGFGGGLGITGTTYSIGYTGLIDYPLSGPNYAKESDVELPTWLITNKSTFEVQETVCGILQSANREQQNNPNEPLRSCSICWGTQSPTLAAQSYGGPGAFFWWGIDCNGNVTFVDGDGNIVERVKVTSPLYSAYVYNRQVTRTLSGQALLYGVNDGLDPNINPQSDPNYSTKRKTFIDVLKDPVYTITQRPWLYGGSRKWIPLCWTSPFILPDQNYNLPINTQSLYLNNSSPNPFGIIQTSLDFTSTVFEHTLLLDDNFPDGREFSTNLRTVEMPSFVLETNNFTDYVIKAGMMEFTIPCTLTRDSNTCRLYSKMYKLQSNGQTQLIQESDLSEIIVNIGFNQETDGANQPIENTVWQVKFILDIPEDLQMTSTDKILFKLYLEYYNNLREEETIFKAYFSGSEGSFNNRAKLIYTKYDENYLEGNQICFSGVSGNEGELLGNDPNAVVYQRTVDEEGNVQIDVRTAFVKATAGECCPP